MNLFRMNREGIGRDLQRARQWLKLSLADAAARAGIAASHLWSVEHGRREVSLEKFLAICGALGLAPIEVLSDNLEVSKEELFRKAGVELGRKLGAPSDETLKVIVVSDYVSGCATILIYALLGMATPSQFELPGQQTKDALSTVAFRLMNASTLRERVRCLARLAERPVAEVQSLLLLTAPLLEEFAKQSQLKTQAAKEWSPWTPKKDPSIDTLLDRAPTTALELDPRTLGELFRELSEQQESHLIRDTHAAIKHIEQGSSGPKKAGAEQKKALTALTAYGKHGSVTMANLLSRLNKATCQRGMKSKLAKFMGVPLANVSQWLSGEREPGGQTTLKLLSWVERHEGKQQKPLGRA